MEDLKSCKVDRMVPMLLQIKITQACFDESAF